VNDRGPFLSDRIIDLSYMAARKLGVVETGTAKVFIETVFADGAPKKRTDSTVKPSSSVDVADNDQQFVIQAGSFASKTNAARLKSLLLKGGYSNVIIQRVVISERVYHRVQMGPYDGHQSARLIANTVEEHLNSPVSVIKVPG
jgi:rare lipoprotein A